MASDYQNQAQDDYQFLLCCNLIHLIATWDAYDGEQPPIVLGREVDEKALVYAMQELGCEVVI